MTIHSPPHRDQRTLAARGALVVVAAVLSIPPAAHGQCTHLGPVTRRPIQGPNQQFLNNQVFNTSAATSYATQMVVAEHRDYTLPASEIRYAFADPPGLIFDPEAAMPVASNLDSAPQNYDATNFAEPWVTYDRPPFPIPPEPILGGYLCVAIATAPGNTGLGLVERRAVLANWFHPVTQAWGTWEELASIPLDNGDLRRPVILTGADDEFYVVWTKDLISGADGYGMARLTGTPSSYGVLANWDVQPTIVEYATGTPIEGVYAMFAAVSGTSDLFCAYMRTPGEVRFLRGVDAVTEVRFSVLEQAFTPGTPLKFLTNAGDFSVIPGKHPGFGTTYTPQIAIDPTNHDRLYVGYHDLAAAGSTNVDVFTRTVDRRATRWALGPAQNVTGPLQVPLACQPDPESDQFLAGLLCDGGGRVNVAFYDDRDICQNDSVETTARYQLTFAYSCDGGQSYVNVYTPPTNPFTLDTEFVDYARDRTTADEWSPHEYMGLAFAQAPATLTTSLGTEFIVVAAFAGTSSTDPDVLPPEPNQSGAWFVAWAF